MTINEYRQMGDGKAALYSIGFRTGIELAIQYLERAERFCESAYDKSLLSDTIEDLEAELSSDDEVISAIFLSNSDKDFTYHEKSKNIKNECGF